MYYSDSEYRVYQVNDQKYHHHSSPIIINLFRINNCVDRYRSIKRYTHTYIRKREKKIKFKIKITIT